MFRASVFLLIFSLLPLLRGAEARREAIVVLADLSLIEQFRGESPGREVRRERLHSREAEEKLLALQLRKASLAAAVRQAGAEPIGQTEVVLNALMVRATPAELEAVRRIPGVQSAEFAAKFKLLLDGALPLIRAPEGWSLPSIGGEENAGRGIKIGVIDTGIDQSHPMFQDAQLVPPPGFPKGETALTNSKVIVARNFVTSVRDASDANGHGTFVAGIAAGHRTPAQPFLGPVVSISGVAPKAYLGNYRVFGATGSADETAIIRAIESAVVDGMDVLNLSLGLENPGPPSLDSFASAMRNANTVGTVVVAAAGNAGPSARTIDSPATLPTVLSVGATTNSRIFVGSMRVTGPAPVPPGLTEVPALPSTAPIQTGLFGPASAVDITPFDITGLGCPPGSDGKFPVALPAGSLAGKVALILRGQCKFRDKVRNAANAGAVGVVIYNNLPNSGPVVMLTDGGQIPSISIGNQSGRDLRDFLANKGPLQIVFDPGLSSQPAAADILAGFSSRGPIAGSDLKIKPDVVAPGQTILSAVQRLNSSGEMFSPTGFALAMGTSFSSPMVAGAAALVKQAHPAYRPEDIKSVLVNTADPVTSTEDGATVHAQNIGAGRVNVPAAVNATIVAEPVSLSFGARSPRGTFRESQPVKISNVGATSDTLTLSVVPRTRLANVSASLEQTSLTLAPGQGALATLTLSNSGLVQAVADGLINVRSGNTGRSINIPYWVTFLIPDVNPAGVVNAASFQGTAGVSPGSIVSIFGVSLSSSNSAVATSVPLPTELGGTKIVLNNVEIPLFFSSPMQLNAQIPYDAAFDTTLTATPRVDGIGGQPFLLRVSQFSPGLFTRSQDGRGAAAALHADGSVVAADSPAGAGETVLLYGTGLGPVSNPPGLGRPAISDPLSFTTTTPSVLVAGREAGVTFSGLAPGFVGLYQVNVTLPTGLAAGDQPLILTIGGVSSNTVTLPIR